MKIEIRFAQKHDLPALQRLSEQLKQNHEEGEEYFVQCLERVQSGERDFYVAVKNDILVGYVMLVWRPRYQPFRRLNMPEIQDLNVIQHMRRQGVGSSMLKHCEKVAKEKGHSFVGIGVGLHRSYGPAQRMYIARGYVPDGGGAVYENKHVQFGEMKPLDDNYVLKMIKEFS